jgi:hypothetical protein
MKYRTGLMEYRTGALLVFLWLLSFVGFLNGWMVHPGLALITVVFFTNFLMRHDPESSWA